MIPPSEDRDFPNNKSFEGLTSPCTSCPSLPPVGGTLTPHQHPVFKSKGGLGSLLPNEKKPLASLPVSSGGLVGARGSFPLQAPAREGGKEGGRGREARSEGSWPGWEHNGRK